MSYRRLLYAVTFLLIFGSQVLPASAADSWGVRTVYLTHYGHTSTPVPAGEIVYVPGEHSEWDFPTEQDAKHRATEIVKEGIFTSGGGGAFLERVPAHLIQRAEVYFVPEGTSPEVICNMPIKELPRKSKARR